MQALEFKVSLIGNTLSGKTSFIERLLYGQAKSRPIGSRETLGVNVTPFDYRYGNNRYRINFWDCAGDNRYIGLGRDYIKNSDLIAVFSSGDAIIDQSFIEWIPQGIPYITVSSNNNTQEIITQIRNRL